MTKQKQEDFCLLSWMFVAVLLAQIFLSGANGFFLCGAYIIILIYVMMCPLHMVLGSVLVLLPNNRIFDEGGISIQLIIMLIYLIRLSYLKKIIIDKKLFIWAGLFVFFSFQYFFIAGISAGLQGCKTAVLIVFLTEALMQNECIGYKNYTRFLYLTVYGVIISVVIAIMVNPDILLQSRVSLSSDSNWNILGILAASLYGHCVLNCFFTKTTPKEIFAIVTMLSVTLMTTSRTAILVCFLSSVWVLIVSNRARKNTHKKMLFCVIAIVFCVLLLMRIIEISFVDALIDRIINPRQGDISNGRFSLWYSTIIQLIENWTLLFFGAGTSLISGVYSNTGKNLVAHNMLLEQLVAYGLVGNLLIVNIYLNSINKISKSYPTAGNKQKRRISLAMSITLVFIVGIFSHLFTSVVVTIEMYLAIIQWFALDSQIKRRHH